MSTAKFKDEDTFCRAFVERLRRTVEPDFPSGLNRKFMESLILRAENYHRSFDLTDMFDYLTDLCANSDRPIVLIIDEVDNACNNQIFPDFLGQLRDLYLNRTIL